VATTSIDALGEKLGLVSEWIPALDGVKEKLEIGASVADIGCGHGTSTIILAQAYPNSRFHGFDYHAASIERAREAAAQAGVADRISFEVASAKDYPGTGYDLVCVLDCLDDMGDPAGASAHVLETLSPTGTWMIRLSLGALAGEARLTEVIKKGGFTRVRRATETPFNLVLEARP
jgi:trans-aconitate methyltransferase